MPIMDSLTDHTTAITSRIDAGEHEHVATLDTPALTVTLLAVAGIHQSVTVFSDQHGQTEQVAVLCGECSGSVVIETIEHSGWTADLPGQVEHPCRTLVTMNELLSSACG